MQLTLPTGRRLMASGTFNLFLVILLGALASHALKPSMTALQMEYWQTALFYQTIHAFGLILLAFLCQKQPGLVKFWGILGKISLVGILFFSGGLYLLALGFETLHFLIPIGGILWLIHWLALSWLILTQLD